MGHREQNNMWASGQGDAKARKAGGNAQQEAA